MSSRCSRRARARWIVPREGSGWAVPRPAPRGDARRTSHRDSGGLGEGSELVVTLPCARRSFGRAERDARRPRALRRGSDPAAPDPGGRRPRGPRRQCRRASPGYGSRDHDGWRWTGPPWRRSGRSEDTPFKLLVSPRHCPRLGRSVTASPLPDPPFPRGKQGRRRPKGRPGPLAPQLPAPLGWSFPVPGN